MRNKVILCVFLWLGGFVLVTLAQENASEGKLLETLLNPGELFVYDGHSNRDPFLPLVTSSGSIITLEKDFVISDMVLEGIMTEGSGKNIAIINGRILGKNEAIGSFVVMRIEKDSVVLQKDKKIYILKLKKED